MACLKDFLRKDARMVYQTINQLSFRVSLQPR